MAMEWNALFFRVFWESRVSMEVLWAECDLCRVICHTFRYGTIGIECHNQWLFVSSSLLHSDLHLQSSRQTRLEKRKLIV